MNVVAPLLSEHNLPVKVIVPRRSARKVLSIPVLVADKGGLTRGMVTDISEQGCALRLAPFVFLAHYLTLKLYPNGGTAAVQITLAKIRWLERELAGVEFVSLAHEDRTKLQRLCSEQIAFSL